MRPVELVLDGFRSYGESTTFSWEGRRLVGIVGPIGSGKSSILDGIAFALYGKTPRVERDVRSLIHQRRDEGKVALTFDVDGVRWQAIRSLRRKGASAHTLYRLVDGDPVEEVDRAREMTERVSDLLGLDWDAFRRSVLLAQNQFAGFLEATGGQRNQVLKGVFAFEGLDAMRDVAKKWLDEADLALARLSALRDKATSDRRDLDAALAEQATVAGRAEALEAVAAAVAKADAAGVAAREALDGSGAALQHLAELAERLPDRSRVEAVLERAGAAAAALRAAEQAVSAAQSQAEDAAKRRDAVLGDAGGREALEQAAALLASLAGERKAADAAAAAAGRAATDVQEAQGKLREAEQTAGTLVGEGADAELALEAAGTALDAARANLHQARYHSMALSVRSELEPGEPCPVCLQAVGEIPATESDPDVAEAEAAVAVAEGAETEARRRATNAATELAAARSRVEDAGRNLARTEQVRVEADALAAAGVADSAATLGRLGALLGEGDPESILDERRATITAADGAVTASAAAVGAALAERDSMVAAAADGRDALTGLATETAAIAARLDLDVDARPDPAVLGPALEAVRTAWLDARSRADAAGKAAQADLEAAAARRNELLSGVGLEPDADFAAAVAAATTATAAIGAQIEVLQRRLGDLEKLEKEEGVTLGRRAMLERLHTDLTPSRFQAFVLDEYRRALAELGSEQFEVLSGGRYRFSDDGEFDVVDLTAAEQVRSADSLSGGETFLASLALALALAEMVARQGGRLDAFFLDEGFGSLDAEHLDLAMEGVERLVAGADRLVVVVSHVAALRERIEDLVELDKDPLTGATRVHAGAGFVAG